MAFVINEIVNRLKNSNLLQSSIIPGRKIYYLAKKIKALHSQPKLKQIELQKRFEFGYPLIYTHNRRCCLEI